MKTFRRIFLLLISTVLLFGCVSTKNYVKENISPPKVSAVLSEGYKTALYKAKIDFGSKHYSGLFFFKVFPDSSHRIVFMSEFGLNLLDLEYRDNSFKIISCKDFLDNKAILNTIQNDMRLLIDFPDNVSKKQVYTNTDSQTGLIKLNEKLTRWYYFYTLDKEVNRIVKTNGLKRVDLSVHKENSKIPQEIFIDHNIVKLSIKLDLLKVK